MGHCRDSPPRGVGGRRHHRRHGHRSPAPPGRRPAARRARRRAVGALDVDARPARARGPRRRAGPGQGGAGAAARPDARPRAHPGLVAGPARPAGGRHAAHHRPAPARDPVALLGAAQAAGARAAGARCTCGGRSSWPGMVDHCDFVEQQRLDDGARRPDVVVHLAGGRQLVVDAKVPLDAFLDACATDDDDVRERHLRRHAAQLRSHVDGLSAKRYWRSLPTTPEFVVMFVPAEAFLGAALDVEADLIEYAAARQVVLATPTTLIALLRTVAHGWTHEALTEQAREIQRLGRELHERLGTLDTHLDQVGPLAQRRGRALQPRDGLPGVPGARHRPPVRRARGARRTTCRRRVRSSPPPAPPPSACTPRPGAAPTTRRTPPLPWRCEHAHGNRSRRTEEPSCLAERPGAGRPGGRARPGAHAHGDVDRPVAPPGRSPSSSTSASSSACVAVAWRVRPSDFFTVGVLPPLLMLARVHPRRLRRARPHRAPLRRSRPGRDLRTLRARRGPRSSATSWPWPASPTACTSPSASPSATSSSRGRSDLEAAGVAGAQRG